jgi:hypothetical protein
VVDEHGEDAWDEILHLAGVEGAYTSLGDYPDAELVALVGAACTLLDAPQEDVLRGFGRVALPALVARYPEFLAAHTSTTSFLLTLDHTIHREVMKLYPQSRPPRFDFSLAGGGDLVMHYRSDRRLCAFAEGMIQGAAAHFGETAEVRHERCMHDGADHCTLVARFT